MRCAIDTNILSALWSGETAASNARQLLLQTRGEGGLVICGPVYSEVIAIPGVTPEEVDGFLVRTGIVLEVDLPKSVWQEAGLRFAKYARRRKKAKDGAPRRLLVDFLIGAHALLRADRLLTFNQSDYRSDFPDLKLIGD